MFRWLIKQLEYDRIGPLGISEHMEIPSDPILQFRVGGNWIDVPTEIESIDVNDTMGTKVH